MLTIEDIGEELGLNAVFPVFSHQTSAASFIGPRGWGWGVQSRRGAPSLALWLRTNRLQRLPDGTDGEINMMHGLSLTQSSPLRNRKKSSFPSLELEYGTPESFPFPFIPPHMPSSCNNKRRCLNMLGDPSATKTLDSYLAPVRQSFFTTTPAPG